MGEENKLHLNKFTDGDKRDRLAIKFFPRQNEEALHEHDSFELAYVMEGRADHIINGVTGVVQKGDYFIVDYGSKHGYKNCENFRLVNCLFFPEILDATLYGCQSFDELVRICLIRYNTSFFGKDIVDKTFHDEDGRVLRLLLEMRTEYEQKIAGFREIFKCRLLEILVIIMRQTMQKQELEEKNKSEHKQLVRDIIEYLEMHYKNKKVLTQFCEEYHYSQQYISKLFKQDTGSTLLEYLQRIRIKRSCELLASSEMRIQEIANYVGYGDVKFFNSIFKRIVNMTPNEYRQHMKVKI